MTEVEEIARAIRDGALAVLPTDTVYGLVCTAVDAAAAADLYRLKGRSEIQPTALLAASVDVLLECIPELGGTLGAESRARCFPGPFTLVCRTRPGVSAGSRGAGRRRSESACRL